MEKLYFCPHNVVVCSVLFSECKQEQLISVPETQFKLMNDNDL